MSPTLNKYSLSDVKTFAPSSLRLCRRSCGRYVGVPIENPYGIQ